MGPYYTQDSGVFFTFTEVPIKPVVFEESSDKPVDFDVGSIFPHSILQHDRSVEDAIIEERHSVGGVNSVPRRKTREVS